VVVAKREDLPLQEPNGLSGPADQEQLRDVKLPGWYFKF